MLVHDLLLAGIGHHLLLVLHNPLCLAPELHGLYNSKALLLFCLALVDPVQRCGSVLAQFQRPTVTTLLGAKQVSQLEHGLHLHHG